MTGPSLRWYWNRLRQMSLPEVGHRVRRLVRAQWERTGRSGAARPPAPRITEDGSAWLHPDAGFDLATYRAAGDAISGGALEVLGLGTVQYGDPPEWNRDPRTGVRAPLRFAAMLDHRDPSVVGDIRYLWELNRHHQFVVLAQAYRLSHDERYLSVLRCHLESWFDQCPYLYGPNWTSGLEVGLRLINWSAAWQLAGGAASPLFAGPESAGFRDRWLASVYQHAHFIRHHFSAYSSANNHLIGEAAGLYVAALTWPYWNETMKWRRVARDVLEREALLQNAPDGVNREQSVGYLPFILDFLIVAGLAGRAAGDPFPEPYWQRIEAVLEFVLAIMDGDGWVPLFGDGDDGAVLRLDPRPDLNPFCSLLASGAHLFQRDDFRKAAPEVDDRTRWLLGSAPKAIAAGTRARAASARRSFPQGGYHVLGTGGAHSVKLVADAAPLGYGRLAAHGHADALSFTLCIAGHAFLVDPGTFDYFLHPEWRAYFRSTAAHNTVRIDAVDQSVMGGTFFWLHKADARCEMVSHSSLESALDASHGGYVRLEDAVLHRRAIRLDEGRRTLRVVDTLECRKDHVAEIYWHFAEQCVVTGCERGITARRDGWILRLEFPEPARIELVRGRTSPPLGWSSPRFGVRRPSWSVQAAYDLQGTASIETVLRWKPEAAIL